MRVMEWIDMVHGRKKVAVCSVVNAVLNLQVP
jgi:hypothetical protein